MQGLRGRAMLPKHQRVPGILNGSQTREKRLSVCHARAVSHYDVLGVSPNASAADIKSAYRYAARRLHPDVNRQPGAHEAFVECARAYEVLGDQSSRRAYDAEIRSKAASARRSAASPFSSASPRSTASSSSRWAGNPYYTVEYETWTGPSSSSRRGFGSMWSSFDSFDESDSFDEDDDYELDYELWATSDHNYSSSFTSSWQGANGRKKREAAAKREARGRAQRQQQQQQQQQQQASQRRAQANPRGRRASQAQSARSRSSSAMGDDFQDGNAVSVDAVLQALGPEARATAQATFGSRLERLSGAEELVEFLEVLQTLQEDMGLEFELYSTKSRSPRAGPRYSSASSTQSRAGSRFGSVSRGAQASKSSSSSSQKRASASSRSSSAARGADAWAQASPQMRRRAAAQALRQRALGAEVYLRSPNSYNWYLERKTPQPDQLCLLARAVECMHSHITQFWESPWEAPRQRQEQFKQDWVCICADDEGLVLLDADDEDTVVAVPWTEADIDDLEHVAEMYTDAAIMDDEEDELDILDQLVRDYDIGRGTGRGRGSYARARSNL